jgi:hypothetical protein
MVCTLTLDPDVVIDAVAARHGEGLADDAAVIIGPRRA